MNYTASFILLWLPYYTTSAQLNLAIIKHTKSTISIHETQSKTSRVIGHIYKDKLVVKRHQHHHTHPTDIKVTCMQRVIMVTISFSLIAASVYFNNHFTFFAGICVGINWFFLIHYFLHQTWAKKVFPRLLNFHIVHHCKYPNRCFCFSLTLWDDLFNTGIPPGTVISPRIIDFYFGEEHHH